MQQRARRVTRENMGIFTSKRFTAKQQGRTTDIGKKQ